jgi:Predicted dioxygenase
MKIRRPNIAGQYYNSNPEQLNKEILSFIPKDQPTNIIPRILISPNSGCVFSGPVAVKGLSLLPKTINRIIIIGSSLHVSFKDISISICDAYETPLGLVSLANDDICKLRAMTVIGENNESYDLQDTIEIQLPYLQVILNKFRFIPMQFGSARSPAMISDLLLPLLDKNTAIIISANFSHYLSYEECHKDVDRQIATLLSLDTNGDISNNNCEVGLRIAMQIARELKLKAKVIDNRNSYDTAPQYGSMERCVGFLSLAYY